MNKITVSLCIFFSLNWYRLMMSLVCSFSQKFQIGCGFPLHRQSSSVLYN
uniref:BETA-OHASE 1 (BETA-HYDROXYLASE 1) n=1 Tax=Arundo donax TaxID=35708 RepID=A0A0A9BZ26_ARUDO